MTKTSARVKIPTIVFSSFIKIFHFFGLAHYVNRQFFEGARGRQVRAFTRKPNTILSDVAKTLDYFKNHVASRSLTPRLVIVRTVSKGAFVKSATLSTCRRPSQSSQFSRTCSRQLCMKGDGGGFLHQVGFSNRSCIGLSLLIRAKNLIIQANGLAQIGPGRRS